MYSNREKKNSHARFAMKSSFKLPASPTPNEFDRVMTNWWRIMPLQENLKASCFYFAFLTTALFHQPRFAWFCWRKLLTTSETTVNWTSSIWQNPDSFFWTDLQSTSLGVAAAESLKLDLKALKCRNPNFFIVYLFTHHRDTKTAKTLLGRRDT